MQECLGGRGMVGGIGVVGREVGLHARVPGFNPQKGK